MTHMTSRSGTRIASGASLVLTLIAVGCSSESIIRETPSSDSSGGVASGGAPTGSVATGGASSGGGGTGGLATGGAGTGGFATGGSVTGGTSSGGGGTGGLATGGAGTGGFATGGSVTGGTSSGGGGTGGTSSGGVETGGTSSGGDGTGGTSSGGVETGGTSSGGSDTGGAGTGGVTSEPVFHVFMLMGQSNMAGVAKNDAGDRNTDERLLVLGGCNQPAGQWNLANPPLNDCPGEKGWNLSDSVGPGMWFAKTLLEVLPEGDTIGLVGTAESGESIDTFISGGSHHQMILNKIATAKEAPHARFAGVIFHQGESDSGQSSWPGKVVQLYDEVKAAFDVDYEVPFVLGELPVGGCCGGHNTLIHQAADQLPMGYWVSQEGTQVMDQYHFDHPSVILMGQRYGETMIEALEW